VPAKVERAVKAVAAKVKPRVGNTAEGSAIAILKSRGVIKQAGRHLAAGPHMKRGK